jgi:DNA-binding CsgD family transcriptional regulator
VDLNSDDLVQLTEALYGAAYDDASWPTAISRLKDRLGASGASFGIIDRTNGSGDRIYGDCPPEFVDTFLQRDLRNPMVPLLARAPVGAVQTEEHLPEGLWDGSAFLHEWCMPQDARSYMQIKLLQHGDIIVNMSFLGAGERLFGGPAISLLNSLRATLLQVAKLRLRLGAMRLQGRVEVLDDGGTGLMIVDGRGRLLYKNHVAEAHFVDPRSPVSSSRNSVFLRRRAERQRFAALVADAVDQDAMRASEIMVGAGDDQCEPLILSISPMPDAGLLGLSVSRAAMVLIRRPRVTIGDDFQGRAAAFFELTPREAQLAGALARGEGVQQYASAAGITLATARTQLTQLFRKTGTSRQGALVSVLLSATLRR